MNPKNFIEIEHACLKHLLNPEQKPDTLHFTKDKLDLHSPLSLTITSATVGDFKSTSEETYFIWSIENGKRQIKGATVLSAILTLEQLKLKTALYFITYIKHCDNISGQTENYIVYGIDSLQVDEIKKKLSV